MRHKVIRILAILGVAAALVAFPSAAQASAAKAPAHNSMPGRAVAGATIQSTIHFPTPYMATGFGPIAQATQVDGGYARPGFYSPITGQFSSSSQFYPLALAGWFDGNNVCGTDNLCGFVTGYGVLSTPYGGAIYSTQYRNGQGRWGAWNIHTNLFYPSSGWFALA